MASLLWPFHPGPVQNTDAAALKLLVHCTYISMTDYVLRGFPWQLMLKGFLISTTASPQHEHSISKSGDAPKYCLVLSIKMPHCLYLTSL